jgi:hypothetical protein
MAEDKTAAGILERMRQARELMEEVEIIAARDEEAFNRCTYETAREISRNARLICGLQFVVDGAVWSRRDRAGLDGTNAGIGRHERLHRERAFWKRKAGRLEARARDAIEAGKESTAEFYRSMAADYRGRLAALREGGGE